ncbi:MAG TPA: hypothetical protein VGL94_12815 [Ktedonobacteraceae bacterium]|jgi:hypothetical protein
MDKTKLYCFVDENGQETKGRLFIVSVVVVMGPEKDEMLGICEQYEKESRKDKFKWGKAEYRRRMDYLQKIFGDEKFKGKIRYSVFNGTKGYDVMTVEGIARAINSDRPMGNYTTAVYVDGLGKTKRHEYSKGLRVLGVSVHKVQGVTKDENNALVRLADAVAGFVRDVLDGETGEVRRLYEVAVRSRMLIEV